jgi:hypothetical protein
LRASSPVGAIVERWLDHEDVNFNNGLMAVGGIRKWSLFKRSRAYL